MDQFVIGKLFGHGDLHFYSITNQTLWLAVGILAISALFIWGVRGRALVPTRAQSVAEVIYGFVRKMVEDVNGKEGLKYFPWVMTIFVFILFSNALGLLPYSFTTTSHFALTGTLALAIFVSVTVIGLVRNGVGFLKVFWITSAPLALRPFLLLVEVISYFLRPVSHCVRLSGNMMAGHSVIKVFAGFAGALGVGAVAPIFAIVAVYGLEMLVAVIQAYIFAILTCVYLNDALHPGH
ncbi:MAG: F0F1 ATP synthase subunit A [Gammaproteobacteria bacterium]